MLALYLTRHDLTVCAQVSQAWNALFNPHIWRHLDDLSRRGFGNWKYIFSDYCGWEGLKTNAHLVQSLTLHFDSDDRLYLDSNQEASDNFFEFSSVIFPRLTSATFLGLRKRGDLVVGLLKMGSAAGWKELTLGMFDERHNEGEQQGRVVVSADKMVKAILEQAPTLEVLKLDGAEYFASKDVNQLLCTAPNLRDPCLDANDVTQLAWVCKNLEIFGCGIGAIPRPDITRRIRGNATSDYTIVGTHSHSTDLQRRVYSQLSQLTELKELYLGSPLANYEQRAGDQEEQDEYKPFRQDSPLRQFDCLAMTMESGLDLLKELKNLRIVELKDMEAAGAEVGGRELAQD
ncbi:hypothetical protein BGW39_000271 [Mortierella sp. 14UC]|nr:hypothetical protein BGW39_000271 [Mortierella sp. 14UC]